MFFYQKFLNPLVRWLQLQFVSVSFCFVFFEYFWGRWVQSWVGSYCVIVGEKCRPLYSGHLPIAGNSLGPDCIRYCVVSLYIYPRTFSGLFEDLRTCGDVLDDGWRFGWRYQCYRFVTNVTTLLSGPEDLRTWGPEDLRTWGLGYIFPGPGDVFRTIF